jgi:hypothetical protein
MSVSSPTYFGPASSGGSIVGATAGSTTGNRNFLAGLSAGKNSSVSDLILVGHNGAGSSTAIANADMAGAVIIGNGSWPVNANCTTNKSGIAGNPTVVGYNNFVALVDGALMAGVIALGSGIAPALTCANNGGGYRNILIGNALWPRATGDGASSGACYDNIFVGSGSGNTSNIQQFIGNVVIGEGALSSGVYNGGSLSYNVVIGLNAANQVQAGAGASFTHNVIIGQSAGLQAAGGNQVLIGDSVASSSTTVNSFNVAIGTNAAIGSGVQNTVIGTGATAQGSATRNILIGYNAHNAVPANTDNLCAINTWDGVTQRGCLYADMNVGNVLLGRSDGTNRDLNGTQTLKLLAGTKGANPIGGGYFYVTGANNHLHWVDSTGVDSTLGINVAGQLARSDAAYTNNAAAAAGTLGNAPVAGNPTKWIPIDDNGTIRNIPAW